MNACKPFSQSTPEALAAKWSLTQLRDAFNFGQINLPSMTAEAQPGMLANLSRIAEAVSYHRLHGNGLAKRTRAAMIHADMVADLNDLNDAFSVR